MRDEDPTGAQQRFALRSLRQKLFVYSGVKTMPPCPMNLTMPA